MWLACTSATANPAPGRFQVHTRFSPNFSRFFSSSALPDMFDTLRFRNYAAIALLIFGKLFGIVGLAVGAGSRILGGTCLVLSGALLAGVVALTIGVMKARAEEENAQKKVLRQMMKEGTLKQFMRDIEAENRARAALEDGHEPAPARQTAFS